MKRSSLSRGRSPMKRKTKMKQSNPQRMAKRRKIEAKDRRSPHTKEIERQARERSGGRCESEIDAHLMGEVLTFRCTTEEGLEMHHKRYPKGRKLTVDDVQMLCDPCHNRIESLKAVHRKIA